MDSANLLSLPIEQKIGQLLFIGLPSTQIDPSTRRLLQEISPGGICLFARNIHEAEQTRNLIETTQKHLPIPALIGVDQEGGLVDRLRRVVTPMPAASRIQTVEGAELFAKITAETLRILGFNINFAPVVDVIDEKRARFSNGLYSRSFAQTAEESFELAEAYLIELQKNGCLGCLKHFPGLGASETDSHETLPAVYLSENELNTTDLYPYQKFFKTEFVHAVMVAHATYPLSEWQENSQNGGLLPSSLSHNFVTKLLRQKFGFGGLVLTDDLEMGAIVKNFGIGEACKTAILAGEDMVLVCSNSDAIREGHTALLRAVENGEITEQRINDSLQRIAAAKKLLSPPLPFATSRLKELSEEIADLDKKVRYNYGG